VADEDKHPILAHIGSRKMILCMWAIMAIVVICKIYYSLGQVLMETGKSVTTTALLSILSLGLGQNILQWWLDKEKQK